MAKKTQVEKQEPAFTDEQLAQARVQMRKNMREAFDKWMDVKDDDATDDDVNQYKAEFDEEIKKYQNQKYTLTESNATDWINLLLEWNTKYVFWDKGNWRGVLSLNKVLKEFKKQFEENPDSPLQIDYSTLIYLHETMMTPLGFGYESALQMAKLENVNLDNYELLDETTVTYSTILKKVDDIFRELAAIDKKLKLMRERINIALAGIKFDWKITEIEEFVEFHNAWVGQAVGDADIKEAEAQQMMQ